MTDSSPSTNPFHCPAAAEAASAIAPEVDASPAAMSKLRSPFATGSPAGADRDRRSDWS